VDVKVLRQTAIEWIKHFRKLGVNYPIQVWIKEFFNITEGELK